MRYIKQMLQGMSKKQCAPTPRRRGASTSQRLTIACVLLLSTLHLQMAQAGINVGLYFVDSVDEPIDFLTFPGFPPIDYIKPFQLTDSGNDFVTDGAFAGISEADARAAVLLRAARKFREIPTPAGYTLDIDFHPEKQTGAGSVNVLIGKHDLPGYTWYGFSKQNGGLGGVNGETNAAVAANRIDSLLQADFLTFDDAVNTLSNVVAHETAHLYGLDHVWADARADLGWTASDPVVTNPYDVMATGPSGLPDAGWLEDNVFTTVAGTQGATQSSVDALVSTIGLKRFGDFDQDDDVDVLDFIHLSGNFTGAASSGQYFNRFYHDGDLNTDGDVDVQDLIDLNGAFTGSLAGNLTDTAAPDLIYDSETGSVTIDSDGGPNVTGFQLENASLAFVSGLYTAPVGADVSEATNSVLSYFSFSGGFANADLGNVLPTGLDLAALENFLSAAGFSAGFGNSGELDLFVVPEPSSLALLGLGSMLVAQRRRLLTKSQIY